jgi:hypothetical protein
MAGRILQFVPTSVRGGRVICTCMIEDAVLTPSGSCSAHSWMAERREALELSERVSPGLQLATRRIEAALWNFEWAGHDPAFHLEQQANGGVRLSMRIWVADTDDDEESEFKPLNVSQDVVDDESAEEQIRSLIHGYLTHEADEQLFFRGQRPFYPH